MKTFLKRDLFDFVHNFSFAEELSNSIFLITGATGFIGSMLIHCLLALDKRISIIAPVRNVEKAKLLYEQEELKYIRLIKSDLLTFDFCQLGRVDYIVHCASPTVSKYFVEHPVDTFNVIIQSTKALLDYSCNSDIKGFVYLSSLEVYGKINKDTKLITEEIQGYLDLTSARSCYPIAKRSAEHMCFLYSTEFGLPVKIARLTQTTGAGVSFDDNRVITQFARLIANNQDIVLHTSGESSRPYCYITDAISALLYILLKGDKGAIYNVANDDTYISVRDMAFYLKHNFNSSINIRYEFDDNMGYAPVTFQKLSSKKLRDLGWNPRNGLKDIFEKLIAFLQEK